MNMTQKPTGNDNGSASPQVIIDRGNPAWRGWVVRGLFFALIVSVLANFAMYANYQEYFSAVRPPMEKFHSGERTGVDAKIAVVKISGTIMPPFTDQILRSIKKAKEDDRVKGVVLAIDSPGGLVADSHRIYHKLVELREEKPIVVSMQRMAASGGYYVAMGAGPESRIFAEPTTWTGSIGVIIPRYDASGLAEKIGISSEPLKTGEFKDALNPFRELSESERSVWTQILDESFQRFVGVIADNRSDLNQEAVVELATGQIYTAEQALEKQMVDAIGYEDDAIESLKEQLGLDKARVVTYEFPRGVLELLSGGLQAQQPEHQWRTLLEATVPRAMYYCSWTVGVPLQ